MLPGAERPRPAAVASAAAVTVAGLVCGWAALALWPSPPAVALLTLSCVLDAVDGPVARRWEGRTRTGAELDWYVDVSLAHALAWRALAPPLAALACAALLAAQVVTIRRAQLGLGRRISGRSWLAGACGALVVARALGWLPSG